MKVLFFETANSGHRIPHLSAIINNCDIDSVLIIPEYVDSICCKQYILKNREGKNRSLSQYKKMMKEVLSIAEIEKPDIVHFLYGDIFFRFFGYGLSWFKKYKTVLTSHDAKEGLLHSLSTRIISSNVDSIVVTCEYSKDVFERYGVKNVVNFEFPHLIDVFSDTNEAKRFFGICDDIPVIGCIGGTRYDKGLDILLDSLKNVNKPFHLLIAGKEDYFDELYIDNATAQYKEQVIKKLVFLTEKEFDMAINASDFIVLPYRKGFNGGSGPLGEGVWREKCIISPNDKNLGQIVLHNHLGYVFEQCDSNSLAGLLNEVLCDAFKMDDSYYRYRNLLGVEGFSKEYQSLYNRLMDLD